MEKYVTFAATEGSDSAVAQLGIDGRSFLFQLVTFALVFLVLKQFAFKPISEMLQKRRDVIDDGVKMGLKMEKEKSELDKKVAAELRKARAEADKIISRAHKESREIIRDAEKSAQRKTDAMLADAEVRLREEAKRFEKSIEKDIVGLVSEATEAIIEEKVDAFKDSKLIDKAIKGRKKK